MSTFLMGGLVLSLAMLLAVAGLIFTQRRVPLELRQEHNVPLGLVYGALYVTFGVIIGFSAYLVLNKYTTSQNTVVNEASDVRALYYLAGQFPESQRDQIQQLLTSYARAVVDEEWPLMEEGHPSPRAATLDQQITESIYGFQPSTSAEQTLYSQAAESLRSEPEQEHALALCQQGLAASPVVCPGSLSGHHPTVHLLCGNGEYLAAHIGGCGIDIRLWLHHFHDHLT